MKGISNKKVGLIIAVAMVLVSMSVLAVITADTVKACRYVSDMYAGNPKNEDKCGYVTVYHQGSANQYFTVTFTTTGDWVMNETNLAVATSYDGIPQTKSGSPKVGNFPYSGEYDPGLTSVVYTIDLEDYMDMTQTSTGWRYVGTLYFASHAVVYDTEAEREETSWANTGETFAKSWAMYFTISFS